jgi:hypothetical protein
VWAIVGVESAPACRSRSSNSEGSRVHPTQSVTSRQLERGMRATAHRRDGWRFTDNHSEALCRPARGNRGCAPSWLPTQFMDACRAGEACDAGRPNVRQRRYQLLSHAPRTRVPRVRGAPGWKADPITLRALRSLRRSGWEVGVRDMTVGLARVVVNEQKRTCRAVSCCVSLFTSQLRDGRPGEAFLKPAHRHHHAKKKAG